MTPADSIEIDPGDGATAPDVLPAICSDRWEQFRPKSTKLPVWAAIFAASLILHGLLSFALDHFDQARDQTDATSEQEIPVEIVPEIPGEKPQDPGPNTSAPPAAPPPQAEASHANPTTPPAAQQAAPPPKAMQTAQSEPPTLDFPKAPAGPAPFSPPPAKPVPPAPPPAPPPENSDQTGARRAAVEVAPVTRPDVAPTARDTPAPPSFGKPSPEEIEHLFLPDLFKIIAADNSPVASKEEADSYKAVVFDRIIRGRQFPEAARRRGAHGVAVVSFVIDSAGNLGGASIIRSTGDRDLDAEAITMVKRAAPFPPPPPGSVLSFTPLIEFGLE